jgi:tape measure domain-containing protein
VAQDAQLLLKVGLDLSTFRNQLATLGQAAAGYNLPIKVKFDRLAIQNELNALGVNIKRRTYRLNIETNLSAEIKKARDLADALSNIPKGGGAERAAGVAEAGFSQAALRKLGQDIKPLYKAAAQAGMVAFSEEIANNVQKIAKELSEVGKDSIAGLLNGLKSGDSQLKAAAKSLGQSLISSIKGILGIASPSKVFKDIGSDVGKGFELGAVASMDKAFDVLERQLQERLKRLQTMIQPQTSRRGAFPFVAKSGPIESGALFAESTSLARQIDQARAQIAQIQGRRQERLSLQQSALAQTAGRLLPPARDRSLPAARETMLPGGGAVEQVSRGFVQSLRNTRDVLARNFAANTYFPKATRNLASSMNVAARQLTGTKIAGLLPSKEMMEPLRFQRAAMQAARIDAENAARARRPIGGAFPMEGMMGPSRSVDRSFSNYITAEFTRMMRAGALGGGFAFPNAPMMGPSSALPPRGSLGRFPSDGMLAIGGPSAVGQAMAGPTPWYNTSLGARGGHVPGVRSSAFFPMAGMMGPSSPLGRITAQSSMFGGGPPSVPPGGGGGGLGGFGGFGGFGRAMGGINLPGAGLIREIGGEFAFATKQVLLFGQAYKLLGFAQDFPAQVGQAVGELQSFRNTLKAITPTAQEAAKSNALILDLVSKYNIPLESARGGFTKLYASMQPAGFAGEEVRDLFTGISKAAATFGMSSDKVDRVTYAFAQMASKGQVMSEELKGQLGDVLPGAMALFAEAAGFEGPNAIAQFSKALEDGAYKGQAMKDLLNNVTILLNQKFSEGARGAASTFQGSMNNMRNSLKGFYESFEPIAVQFLNSFVSPLSQGLKDATDGINAFFTGTQAKTSGGMAIANELKQLQPALQGIQNNIKQILPVFGQLIKIALEVGKIFLSVAGSPLTGYLVRVYAVVLPVITAFGILRTAVVTMLGPLGLFNAQMLLGVGRFTAFRNAMTLTGATAAQTATAIRGVNAALTGLVARTGIGLAIIGLGMLAERFLSAGAAAQAARQKMLQFADAVKALGEAGDVAGVTVELTEQKALAARIKRAQTLLSDLRAGKRSVSPQQAEELQALGLSSNMAFAQEGGQRNLTVQTMPGAISANLGAAQRGYLEAQTKIIQAERALTQARKQRVETEKGLSKIQGEPDTKGVAKEESAYNQLLQEQLQKQNEINAIGKDELSQLEAKRVLAAQLLKLRVDEINRTQTGRVRDLARSNELLEYKKIVAETDEEWKNITKEISEAATKAQELFDKIYRQDTPEMTPLRKALGDIKKETIDNIQAIDELLNYVNKRVGTRPEYKTLVTSLTQMRGGQADMTPAQQTAAAGVRVTRDIVKDLRSELQTGAQAFAPSTALAGAQAKLGPDWMQLSGQRQGEITQLAGQVDLMKPFIDMAQAIKASREELQKLTDMRYQIVPMAQAIGSSFADSFKGIVSGSMTAQQALANFFQSVGNYFLDMAARMIAKWIEMQIIGLAASLIPGIGGFFGGGARVGQSVALPSGVGIGAGGGILQNPAGQGFGTFGPNFGIRQFANGGIVNGPTMGLIGEGRYNEAIVPLPDGRSIPVEMMGGGNGDISITINVDAKGTKTEGDEGQAKALASIVSAAVQSEIVKQQRPGGLLVR